MGGGRGGEKERSGRLSDPNRFGRGGLNDFLGPTVPMEIAALSERPISASVMQITSNLSVHCYHKRSN